MALITYVVAVACAFAVRVVVWFALRIALEGDKVPSLLFFRHS